MLPSKKTTTCCSPGDSPASLRATCPPSLHTAPLPLSGAHRLTGNRRVDCAWLSRCIVTRGVGSHQLGSHYESEFGVCVGGAYQRALRCLPGLSPDRALRTPQRRSHSLGFCLVAVFAAEMRGRPRSARSAGVHAVGRGGRFSGPHPLRGPVGGIEVIFNLTTPLRLLELGNPAQPLLRRLMQEAPGTYNHWHHGGQSGRSRG